MVCVNRRIAYLLMPPVCAALGLVELGTRAADGREVILAIALWCIAALLFVLAGFSTIYDQRERRRDTARGRRRHLRH